MTTIGERVRMVRKSQPISNTLEKFGEKIGLKKNSLSQIENGINSLSESAKRSICREFGVDPNWLETGEGEMLVATAEFNLDEFARIHSVDELELRILKSYFELDPKIRKEILIHFKENLTGRSEEASSSSLHEELDRQVALEKNPTDESSASSAV